MSTHYHFSRFCLLALSGATLGLVAAGCRAPAANRGSARDAAMPAVGAPMRDVRTEAAILDMEQQYIAEKNSQPSHQPQADAEAAKRKQEREAAAAKQQAGEQKKPE